MDKKTLEELRQILSQEHDILRRQLGRIGKEDTRTPEQDDFQTMFPNYGDEQDENAQEVQSYSDTLSVERNLETSLQDAERALAKMEEGTYGVCENCGKPIPLERLRAFPAARLCTTCMEKKS